MRRLILSILIAAIAFLTTTFAGMAFFGMDGVMNTGHGYCTGTGCDAMPHDMSGADCIDQCLSSIPPSVPAAAPALALAIILTLALFFTEASIRTSFLPAAHRFREVIGKILLRQRLATVILRN